MALIRDYFEKTKDYKKLYGEKTVVFMQVGAFYEVYALLNEDGTYIEEIRMYQKYVIWQLQTKLEVILVVKLKEMAGFQTYLIDKFSKKLLDAGFTIPKVNQDQQAANSTRSLYCILLLLVQHFPR